MKIYHASGGDRGIIPSASTISLKQEVAMTKAQYQRWLWQRVVDDYYKDANFYLGVK